MRGENTDVKRTFKEHEERSRPRVYLLLRNLSIRPGRDHGGGGGDLYISVYDGYHASAGSMFGDHVYFQPVGRDQRSHDGSHCRPDQYKMGALPSMADPGSRAPDHFFHTDVDQSESAHHGKGGILFGRIYGLRNDQNHVYYAPCGAPACLCEK